MLLVRQTSQPLTRYSAFVPLPADRPRPPRRPSSVPPQPHSFLDDYSQGGRARMPSSRGACKQQRLQPGLASRGRWHRLRLVGLLMLKLRCPATLLLQAAAAALASTWASCRQPASSAMAPHTTWCAARQIGWRLHCSAICAVGSYRYACVLRHACPLIARLPTPLLCPCSRRRSRQPPLGSSCWMLWRSTLRRSR